MTDKDLFTDTTNATSEPPTRAAQSIAEENLPPTLSGDGAPASTSRHGSTAAPNSDAKDQSTPETKPAAKSRAKTKAKARAEAKPEAKAKTSASRPPKVDMAKEGSDPSRRFADHEFQCRQRGCQITLGGDFI
jgi:hypothetical protein